MNQGKNTNEHELIFRVEKKKTQALALNKAVHPEDRQQFRFTENFDWWESKKQCHCLSNIHL